ncbi:Glyoxylate reductase [uncultured archaeon]|nr:Glyoxylate reductase [uncultured archaeon]
MKITVAEPMKLTSEQKARLEKLGAVRYFESVPDLAELLKRAEDADILAVDWSPIDAAIPKMQPGVKLISLPFTGVGFLPLKEAALKGIKISNSPGSSTESVGEFGVGLMLALVRRICACSGGKTGTAETPSLYGKTIGILGKGRIGSYVGKLSEAIGMRVTYLERRGDLLDILRNSDVIYSALPLSEETEGLLGEKEFASMKSGSYFVTTSHNLIYDHGALLKALDRNLAGAAMDLEGISTGDYKNEVYCKFKDHPRILATPHIAYKTDYAMKRGYDLMIDNIEAFVAGNPKNVVN